MDKVALLDASDRAALFGETGAARGVANTVIEKDFWVCWTLRRLFKMPKKDAPTLIFKGGTSLSKAFGAIRRFSEDIDLSFDRADLGYTGIAIRNRKGSAGSRRASSSRISSATLPSISPRSCYPPFVRRSANISASRQRANGRCNSTRAIRRP